MKAYAEELEAPAATLTAAAPPTAPQPDLVIDDKRKYLARIPVELRLRLTAVNYSGPARSLNLSVTGLLIETPVPLVLDERLILTITHPAGEASFNICAEVCRVASPSTPTRAGHFGLRVLTDDSLAWQNFLRLLVLKQ
jgi:hypothetical protein